MQMLRKFCRKSEPSLSFPLWKRCYRKNKPEADHSNAPRWTFSFISA